MIENSFYLEVNRDAILHNVEVLKSWKQKNVIPVIKANAYGHGIEEMTKTCIQAGLDLVAVARFEEAKMILDSPLLGEVLGEEVKFQVLVFESILDATLLGEYPRIDVAINRCSDFQTLLEKGISTKRFHLKLDLGFARNGLAESEILDIARLAKEKNLVFKGIFSHLFAASYQDGLALAKIFQQTIKKIGTDRFEHIHLQNSAASYNYDFDFVTDLRVGMLVYGLQEPGYFHKELQQAFRLCGGVDSIQAGDSLAYVAYESKEDMEMSAKMDVAKIKIGYADGFGKQNEGSVCLIRGKEYRIIQVTMDNSFVEVDDRVQVGDEVELFYNPSIVKRDTGRQIYENLTILSGRLPRKWIGEKE